MKKAEEYALISRIILYDDHKAFENLMRLHQNAIKNFLLKLLNFNENELDDLFQDTCTKIFQNIKKFRGDATFSTWAFKIAYNTFLNAHQRASRLQSFKQKIATVKRITTAEHQQEAKMDIEKMIAILRPEEKVAIQLSYIQGLSHKDIAQVLNCPIGTVKSLIKRGKERIAKSFKKYDS